MNLQPCSVGSALVIVGDVLGLSPKHDREEVLAYLNRIRSLWYHTFHRKRLFDDWLECVPVRDYRLSCSCDSCYRGIALPLNMAGPVAAWINETPTNLRSRWREKFVGRWASAASLDLIEQPGEYPTSIDPPGQFKLRALAQTHDDGKTITVRGETCDGENVTVCLKLQGDSWVESPSYISRITSIVLPQRDQRVHLAARLEDGGDMNIDDYSPVDPEIPSFRRFKVATPCSNVCQVWVQSSRRFSELYYDTDIVEIGDRLILEHGASYFKNGENTTDTKEIQRADRDLQLMNELIRGMMAREQGDAMRDGSVAIRGSRTRKARLPGYDGRR